MHNHSALTRYLLSSLAALILLALICPVKGAEAMTVFHYQWSDRTHFEVDVFSHTPTRLELDLGASNQWIDPFTHNLFFGRSSDQTYELLTHGLESYFMFDLIYNTWDPLSPFNGISDMPNSERVILTPGILTIFDMYDEQVHQQQFTYYTLREQPVPTPEPSTILLLGAGLVGLLAVGRKRFNRS